MCDGKIKDAACNKEYHSDVIIRRDKRERHSGGHCTSPNKCTDCNNGFYSDGPYCQSKCQYDNVSLLLSIQIVHTVSINPSSTGPYCQC